MTGILQAISFKRSYQQRPNASSENHGSSARNDNNGSAYFVEDGQRHSRRTLEAAQNAQVLLKTRNEELQRQRDQTKRLERENSRLRKRNENIRQERDGLKSKRKWVLDRYECVLDNALRPYAKTRGMRFNDASSEALQSVVSLMFDDATEAKNLRAQVQQKDASIRCIRQELCTLKREVPEIKVLRREVLALQKEDREIERLRNRVQLLQQETDEVRNLREQVQTLQRAALAKVEKIRVVPDNQFAQDFRALVAMVRSFSRSVRPSNDTDIIQVLGVRILLVDVQEHHWNTRARMKCFVEAWVWSVLIELVFLTPFTIFNCDGEHISDLWSKMFDAEAFSFWPTPSPQCELWRCSTMELLVDTVGRATITRGEEKQLPRHLAEGRTQSLQKGILQARAAVADTIRSRLSAVSPTSDFSQIRNLVDKAFTLAVEMSLQRSRLQVTYPQIGATFNKDQMSPIPDRSGEDIEEGTVAFVANPGLTKWGDAEGRKLDCRYDIIPSLVQLEASVKPEAVVVKPEPKD